MMTVNGELILYRDAKAFLALGTVEAQQQVNEAWRAEAAAAHADFDFLFGLGQVARLHSLQVEPALHAWLTESPTARRVDIAGCFLMGFWAVARQPSPALVSALLEAVETGAAANDPTARSTALWAVGVAAQNDGALLDTVQPRFRKLRGAASSLEPNVLAVVDAVLSAKRG